MKCLYIGKFDKHHNTENYVKHALEELGVHVRSVKYNTPSTSICRFIDKLRPHFVLFSKPYTSDTETVLHQCRRKGILTVTWLWDLYWGYRSDRPPQFQSDLLFTTDGGHDEQWEVIGTNHHCLRQGIHEPEHKIFPADYKYDVAFVGSGGRAYKTYPHRNRLIEWLKKEYGNVFFWHTQTRGIELNKALSRVKVVVGDSYPSPKYWSNRVYEITGRGGFLLHPHVEGMKEEWRDREDLVFYERTKWQQDLKKKIDYYIKHDEAREFIRHQGWQTCGRHYTYTHRCTTLLQHITTALGHPVPDAPLGAAASG